MHNLDGVQLCWPCRYAYRWRDNGLKLPAVTAVDIHVAKHKSKPAAMILHIPAHCNCTRAHVHCLQHLVQCLEIRAGVAL